MDRRLARRLIALYPRAWRSRYGDEFAAFLEDSPSTLASITNVIGSAIRERACGAKFSVDTRQRSLALMTYAYLSAVAAGVNFYFSVDDTGLAIAMRSNVALGTAFRMVSNGSVLALVAVLAVAAPLVTSMLRVAFATRRWEVVGRLMVPVGAARSPLPTPEA
jgi:hypothetical protein